VQSHTVPGEGGLNLPRHVRRTADVASNATSDRQWFALAVIDQLVPSEDTQPNTYVEAASFPFRGGFPVASPPAGVRLPP
jgi:hypothetical protein